MFYIDVNIPGSTLRRTTFGDIISGERFDSFIHP